MSTLLDPCTDTPEFTLLPTTITEDCYIVHDDEVIVYWQGKEYTHYRSEYATPPLKVEGKVCNENWYASGPCTGVQFGYEVRIEKEELPPTGLNIDFTGALLIGAAVLIALGASVFTAVALKNRRK